MKRAAILYCAGLILLGVAIWLTVKERASPSDYGLVPLRSAISESHLRASFQAAWSEPHYVGVAFTTPIQDAGVRTFVERARSQIGYFASRPSFDLEWRVLEGSKLVGHGSGKDGATGALMGEGEMILEFGRFPARATHTYTVELSTGPQFASFLAARPLLEIGVATAQISVGLAYGRAFEKLFAQVLVLVAVAVLTGAGLLHWKASRGRR